MITKRCIVCGTEHELNVTTQEMRLWYGGMHMCDAMPNLDKSHKKLLLTGMCTTCFDEIGTEEEVDNVKSA